MSDLHAFRFVLGVICVLVLTLSVLVLPDQSYPLLFFVLIGLVFTWREYVLWSATHVTRRHDRR